MKINSINNQSFKALIVNRDNQTAVQKKIIDNVLSNKFLTEELINNLENEYSTDIVVSANPDEKTVDLSLMTTTDFLGFCYTPYDNYGRKFKTNIKPEGNDKKLSKRNIFIQTALFLKHAENLDLSFQKNIDEVDKLTDKVFRE